jgi:hypothetical protein
LAVGVSETDRQNLINEYNTKIETLERDFLGDVQKSGTALVSRNGNRVAMTESGMNEDDSKKWLDFFGRVERFDISEKNKSEPEKDEKNDDDKKSAKKKNDNQSDLSKKDDNSQNISESDETLSERDPNEENNDSDIFSEHDKDENEDRDNKSQTSEHEDI